MKEILKGFGLVMAALFLINLLLNGGQEAPSPVRNINNYSALVEEVSLDYVGSFALLTEQMEEAASDELIIYEQDWIDETLIAIKTIQRASNRIIKYNPTSTNRSHHQQMKKAANLYLEAMELYTVGIGAITTENMRNLSNANSLVEEGTAILASLPPPP